MLPDINLLPKYERQSSIAYILFLVGLVISIVLFIVLIYFYFSTKNSLEDTEQQVNQLTQEKTILEERLAQATTDDGADTLENAVAYAEHHIVPTSTFIDELFTLLPENSYISNYNYNYQTVDIETQFETMHDAAAYVEQLNESNFVRNVVVNQMNTVELATEQQEEEVNDERLFETIPRYNVSYSIDVNQNYLKEEGNKDE